MLYLIFIPCILLKNSILHCVYFLHNAQLNVKGGEVYVIHRDIAGYCVGKKYSHLANPAFQQIISVSHLRH